MKILIYERLDVPSCSFDLMTENLKVADGMLNLICFSSIAMKIMRDMSSHLKEYNGGCVEQKFESFLRKNNFNTHLFAGKRWRHDVAFKNLAGKKTTKALMFACHEQAVAHQITISTNGTYINNFAMLKNSGTIIIDNDDAPICLDPEKDTRIDIVFYEFEGMRAATEGKARLKMVCTDDNLESFTDFYSKVIGAWHHKECCLSLKKGLLHFMIGTRVASNKAIKITKDQKWTFLDVSVV